PPLPQVVVTGITPSSVLKNTVTNVTITGSGFAAGMTVKFENGSGREPILSKVKVVDATTITAVVTTKKGGAARAATWDLRVGNGILANAFTIYP
ncbi:MAG TPA: hypothetical protein VLB07_13790, partial [Woeseiaceae bacterium]|nr:hypothetical protein [Woeseiaceae bacterium]